MAYIDYHKYLRSPEWKARAIAFKTNVGYKCQLCGKKGNDFTLNVHHNDYKTLGNESSRDVIVLCRECHARFHDKLVTTPEQVDPESKVVLTPIVRPVREGNERDYLGDSEKTLVVIVRGTQDKARDVLRLRRIHGVISTFPGSDRFIFHVFEGNRGHLLEWPDFGVGIAPGLLKRLRFLVGPDNVRVDGVAA